MAKGTVYIDGNPVAFDGEKNLLSIVRKTGIDLPTFCYDEALAIHGACRMCMVEDEKGGLVASCSEPPRDGMKFKTNTARLRKYRKNILELLLANHCRDCTTCENSGKCRLQELVKRFGISEVRFPNFAQEPKPDNSSCSVAKDQNKCILCGNCVRMCNDIQDVGAIAFAHRGSKMSISTAFGVPMAESNCVGCGQCAAVCPTGAIVVKNDIPHVWKALYDPNVFVTVQVAPAVRVGLGCDLGLADDENGIGKIFAALRHMGFDKVFDTSTTADLTIMEEAAEFVERLGTNPTMPLFTSCCPAWIHFVETKYPEMMPNVSSCKSPMQMFSKLLREKYNPEAAAEGKKHVHIAVMPCTAKKFEAARGEFVTEGQQDVDYVLSTQELIRMIQEAGLDFSKVTPEAPDQPFGEYSGGGVIFGNTGGVTEAVLRRVTADKKPGTYNVLAATGVRGMEGVKEFAVPLGDKELKIAVASGLANAGKLLDKLKTGEVSYDFVEVMACPGGCACGGGQPPASREQKEAREKGLYDADSACSIRSPELNPIMDELYATTLKGHKNHELLHVHYPSHGKH